jgi:hypothetical protein
MLSRRAARVIAAIRAKKDTHTVDKQIAAIAMMRDMTLVSRDSGSGFATIVARGLKVLNPFKAGAAPSR